MENAKDVMPRINEYTKMISKDEIICKLHMNKVYKINKCNVTLVGELDYINITNDTLVDIKCSESDFKVEWLIQLLIYYALFKSNNCCCDNIDEGLYNRIDIKKVAIINIFSGKYHEIDIPDTYNYDKLLEYIEQLISNDLKGAREECHDFINNKFVNVNSMLLSYSDSDSNSDIVVDECSTININNLNNENKTGYMVFDVENNSINEDIIQLAYIVYDDNNQETKRFNKYVKDRFVDQRVTDLTRITTDILRKKGEDFNMIMEEYFIDMSNVSKICGHNVHTDIAKIKKNLAKYNIKLSFNIFDTMSVSDTLKMYRTLKGTSIKLSELYKELFGRDMLNAHDALSDVECTAKCYVELNKLLEDKKQKELSKTQIVKKTTTKKVIKKDLSDTEDDDPTIKHILGKIMNTNFFD
jgi:DNA polymerase III epsilon subunit-like protein